MKILLESNFRISLLNLVLFSIWNMNNKQKEESKTKTMKLVHVIPIARGILREQLTYFTSKELNSGSVVSVPIRNKQTTALVVSYENAELSKSQLKSSSYTIKKVTAIKALNFFLPAFIESAKKTAEYFAGTTGSVLNSLIPKAVSEYPKSILQKEHSETTGGNKKNTKQEVLLVQSEDKERMSIYKSIVREEFAKGSSVFFCLPEISEIEHSANTLKRGIEDYTFVFHSGMTKKQILENWKKVLEEKHPVLIVATGLFLSIPRGDVRTIILEKESSRSYKTSVRPYLDIRTFAEFFAEEAGIRLIMGDLFLRPETIYKQKEGIYAELTPLKFRTLSTAVQEVIDMKKYSEKGSKELCLVSDELQKLIGNQRKSNENMFMLTARRGLHPFTVCRDCGNTVLCEQCSAPVVLHKKNKTSDKERITICHKCGIKQRAIDKCNHCGGWRLETLGIGIERVEELLKKTFENITIFRMDRDTVTTHKRAVEMRDKFYNTPGSILLGTEMAISYLNKEVHNTAVISVDSLFTIPDFKINERVFHMLLRLRTKSSKHFIIQTRDIENRIFEYASKGNMIDFYREEIEERKILKYPPFTLLIKITIEGTKSAVGKNTKLLEEKFSAYNPNIFPAFINKIKGKDRMNVLIRIPRNTWVDKKLLDILSSLPPSFAIRVDAENVL